jgi:peptidylprolyl isomerase
MQRTMEKVGDGQILESGDYAEYHIVEASAVDGEVAGSSWASNTQLTRLGGDDVISKLLSCTPVGSRIVAAIPVSEYAEEGTTVPEGATTVVALDVVGGFHGKADGAPQLGQNGLPSIVTAPDGTPGFTFTGGDAPEKIRTELLQKGDGAKVAEGDKIVIQFTGVTWTDETKLTSTWDSLPLRTNASADDTTDTDAGLYFPGTAKLELVGQTVGSQLIIAIPAALGFEGGAGIAEGETVVYVVDILAIQK